MAGKEKFDADTRRQPHLERFRRPPGLICLLLLVCGYTLFADNSASGARNAGLRGFRTNTAKRSIDLRQLQPGGPGKDGIPSLDRPRFVSPNDAASWLKPQEPVISLTLNGHNKAYPLQILIWHEIVNDWIGPTPVLVTFCPLCYSAVVFERRFSGQTHDFGVSGFLRHSDMVMYDRQSESLWQQFTGQAIVGDRLGKRLTRIPAQIISFEQFRQAYPDGQVLSRKTGFFKDYGANPYVGYDDVAQTPFMFRGRTDGRLRPMEKVIAVSINNTHKAYPYAETRPAKVINDTIKTPTGNSEIAVFHTVGAVSALDASRIEASQQAGSTAVFSRSLAGKVLDFHFHQDRIRDTQTQSTWDITGRAIAGPHAGKQLEPIVHGDYFAFAWLVFRPKTLIYRP